MTHQQRSVSGYKSKERAGGGGGGGGKSKQNNFLKLSLPGECEGAGLISPPYFSRPGIVAKVPAVSEVTPGPRPRPWPPPGGGAGPADEQN